MNEIYVVVVAIVSFVAMFVAVKFLMFSYFLNDTVSVESLKTYSLYAGYNLLPEDVCSISLKRSSFNKGRVLAGFEGTLTESKNPFVCMYHSEAGGAGKTRANFTRTILSISIPDTRLQVIINSRLASDLKSGGNLSQYSRGQRYLPEGDFGIFYEIYFPESTQSESLAILSPDSLLYLLKEFSAYDIEIAGNTLYIYSYKLLPAKVVDQMLHKADELMKQLRLRKSDSVTEPTTQNLVALTAIDAPVVLRGLRKNTQRFFGSLAFILFLFTPMLNGVVFALAIVLVVTIMATLAFSETSLKRKYNKFIRNS